MQNIMDIIRSVASLIIIAISLIDEFLLIELENIL
jgi:hypothetical protein